MEDKSASETDSDDVPYTDEQRAAAIEQVGSKLKNKNDLYKFMKNRKVSRNIFH